MALERDFEKDWERDNAYEKQGKFLTWLGLTLIAAAFSFFVLFLLIPILMMCLEGGWNSLSLKNVFFLWHNLVVWYGRWFSFFRENANLVWIMYLPFIPFVVFWIVFVVGVMTNPYQKNTPQIFKWKEAVNKNAVKQNGAQPQIFGSRGKIEKSVIVKRKG